MDDEQDHRSDQAYGLSPLVVLVRVGPADREGIIKDQPRRLKAQTVLPLVGPVLLIPPCPLHASLAAVATLL
jgi:hypothetical protein